MASGEGCQVMFVVVKATSGHYMEYCSPVLGGGRREEGTETVTVECLVKSIIDCRLTT